MSSFDSSDHLLVPAESYPPSLKSRHSTRVSIPPTLLNVSEEDWLSHLLVQPTVIVYSEEKCQELCYRSIEEIRALAPNECLWIEVVGVSAQRERLCRWAVLV